MLVKLNPYRASTMVISFMSRFNRFFHERHLDTMLRFVGEGVHIVLVSVFFRLCFKRGDEDSTAEHPPLPPPFWVLTIPKK